MLYNPYVLSYDLSALVLYLLIILIFFRKKDVYRVQNRYFVIMIFVEIFSVIGDVAGTTMTANPEIFPLWAGSIFHVVYLFFHASIMPVFTCYLILACNIQRKLSPVKYTVIFVPWIVVTLMILSNPIHHRIFYYNEMSEYTRGPWMLYMYATAVYYMLLNIFLLTRYRKSLSTDKFTSVLIFIVASIIATVVQMFYKYLLIELFAEAIAGLWILFTIENDDEVISPQNKIYNRKAFMAAVNTPLESNNDFRVMLVKLTNISYYTNLLGYSFVQKVTCNIADFLSRTAGFTNVFDLENGTFAIIVDDKAKKKEDGSSVEDAICQAFLSNWFFEDTELDFNTQLSIINIPQDVDNIEDLMTIADLTKVKTGSKVTIVQNDFLQQVKRQAEVENAIITAIHKNNFKVYFQPIWDSKENRIHSAEALVRLFDDDLGEISPAEFVPIAEKNGAIGSIGEFVFTETCRFYKENDLKSLGIDFIEVNMSTAQLVHKDLASRLDSIMKRYGLESHTINLEITESSAIDTPDAFLKTIKELRSLDFNLSLDDYGTGYSNISYIFNMDFAIIKIDKSVLWEAEKNDTARIILENTVHMIKEMNLRIVVEGVETEKQKDLVVSLGCDYLQGYLFCKPVPETQFISYVKEFNELD